MGLSERAAVLVGAAVVDFGIQWVGWALALALKTEVFYDAAGSLTFLALSLGSLAYGGSYFPRQVLLTVMACVWTLRLGGFLLARVLTLGGDSRFDEAKHQPVKFFMYWTMQGVWVWVTLLPLLLLNSTDTNPALRWTDVAGVALWALGLACEAAADWQKFAFKRDPRNKGRFIASGLWAWARYPNYFGEMCVWWGAWLAASAAFSGAEWASALCPAAVSCLLLFVSGVPIQEAQAAARWGSDESYREYRRTTWLLLPLPRPAACAAKRS